MAIKFEQSIGERDKHWIQDKRIYIWLPKTHNHSLDSSIFVWWRNGRHIGKVLIIMLLDIHSHVYVIFSLEQSFVTSTKNEIYLRFKSRRRIIVQNIKLFVHVDHKNVWSSYFVCYRLLTFLYTKKWIDCILFFML